MPNKTQFNEVINLSITPKLKKWYREQAEAQSTIYKKFPMTNLMRQALEEYKERNS